MANDCLTNATNLSLPNLGKVIRQERKRRLDLREVRDDQHAIHFKWRKVFTMANVIKKTRISSELAQKMGMKRWQKQRNWR